MWGTVRLQTSTLALWQNISSRSLSLNSHKIWTRGFPGQSGKKPPVTIPVLFTAVNSFSSFVFPFRPTIVQREMVYWRKRIYESYSKPSNIKIREKETCKAKKNISNDNTGENCITAKSKTKKCMSIDSNDNIKTNTKKEIVKTTWKYLPNRWTWCPKC